MKIGEMTEQDLPALAGLYRQFRGEESSPDEMRETFRRLEKDPNYTFLCARRGDRLLGSVLGIICEELYGDCRPFMVVEDVIVDREQRRRGIGSVLMRAIEDQAVSRNCSYIMFVTDSTRVDAPGVLATDLFVLLNSLLPVERVPYRNNLVLYSEPGRVT
jgi:ribosomal protein S18 acetylase RimI-like enzyme